MMKMEGYHRIFFGSFELNSDGKWKRYEIEVTMPWGYHSPEEAYLCPFTLQFEKQDNHVVLVVYSNKQKNDVVEVIRFDNWGRYRMGVKKDTIVYGREVEFYDDFVPCLKTWDEIFDVKNLPDDWVHGVADEGTEIVSYHTRSVDYDTTDKLIAVKVCAEELLNNTSAYALQSLLEVLIDVNDIELIDYCLELKKVIEFICADGFDITGFGLYENPAEGVFVFLNDSTGKFFDVYIDNDDGEEKITAGYVGKGGNCYKAESIKDALYDPGCPPD